MLPWHQSDDTRLDGHRWACHQCHNVGPMTVLRATTHERWWNTLGKANNKPSPIFRLTRKFCIYAQTHSIIIKLRKEKSRHTLLGDDHGYKWRWMFLMRKKPYNFEDLLSAPTKWSNETCKNYATLGSSCSQARAWFNVYYLYYDHYTYQREFQDPKMEVLYHFPEKRRSSTGISGSQNGATSVPYKTIFCGDIPWNLGLNNRPNIYGRYLQ